MAASVRVLLVLEHGRDSIRDGGSEAFLTITTPEGAEVFASILEKILGIGGSCRRGVLTD